MNKLTDSFVLSNGVKVPCVGYGTYLTPNGDVARDSVAKALEGMARQPEAANDLRTNMIIGCAVTETTGIYALLISFLMLNSIQL